MYTHHHSDDLLIIKLAETAFAKWQHWSPFNTYKKKVSAAEGKNKGFFVHTASLYFLKAMLPKMNLKQCVYWMLFGDCV